MPKRQSVMDELTPIHQTTDKRLQNYIPSNTVVRG